MDRAATWNDIESDPPVHGRTIEWQRRREPRGHRRLRIELRYDTP